MALTEGVNSYGSRVDANTYFSDSLRSTTWAGYTNSQKDQALVEATRVLERQPWLGEKEVSTQDLQFPRTGLTDRLGNSIDASTSLEIIKEAQYEYAIALLQDVTLLNNKDATGNNIKKLKAGPAEIEYFSAERGTRFPLILQDLIGSFLSGFNAFSTIGAPYASGTDVESTFSIVDEYGLNRGI